MEDIKIVVNELKYFKTDICEYIKATVSSVALVKSQKQKNYGTWLKEGQHLRKMHQVNFSRKTETVKQNSNALKDLITVERKENRIFSFLMRGLPNDPPFENKLTFNSLHYMRSFAKGDGYQSKVAKDAWMCGPEACEDCPFPLQRTANVSGFKIPHIPNSERCNIALRQKECFSYYIKLFGGEYRKEMRDRPTSKDQEEVRKRRATEKYYIFLDECSVHLEGARRSV